MVQCEHFIYGQFDGLGYRTIKSAGLDHLITRKSLRHLQDLKGRSPIQTLLPLEKCVAVTYLHNNKKDEMGRKTVWNHTIVISIEDYFRFNPPTMFEPHFIRCMSNPYGTLKPLKVETK